ncbi:MAG: ECF transporter S component [Bacillota bacterium]|nr:ECF transporter S component [Bacillota bacterium]
MQNNSVEKINYKTQDLVIIGLMAALAFVVTKFTSIPVGVGSFKAVFHFGDGVIFLAAILFGRKKAALSGALGMFIFDIMSGYAAWSPFTFVIKGVMGLIAGTIAYRKDYNGENIKNNIFGIILSGIWMVAAYFVAGSILMYLVPDKDMGKLTILKSIIMASGNIPSDIMQVVVGGILAVPIAKAVKKTKLI